MLNQYSENDVNREPKLLKFWLSGKDNKTKDKKEIKHNTYDKSRNGSSSGSGSGYGSGSGSNKSYSSKK